MIRKYVDDGLLISYIFKPIYYKTRLKITFVGFKDKKQAKALREVLRLEMSSNVLKYVILINGEEIKDKAP